MEKKLEDLRSRNKLSVEDEKTFREICQRFLLNLLKQIQQRLPDNVLILQKMALLSVSNTLKACKEKLKDLLDFFQVSDKEASQIESQYNKINLVKWTEVKNTMEFWIEVSEYTDASGLNPFQDLVDFAMGILVLPHSNADVERLFSVMNVVQTKLRNRLLNGMVNAILTVRYGLRRHEKCCKTYEYPPEVLRQICSNEKYIKSVNANNNENDDIDVEELVSVFDTANIV